MTPPPRASRAAHPPDFRSIVGRMLRKLLIGIVLLVVVLGGIVVLVARGAIGNDTLRDDPRTTAHDEPQTAGPYCATRGQLLPARRDRSARHHHRRAGGSHHRGALHSHRSAGAAVAARRGRRSHRLEQPHPGTGGGRHRRRRDFGCTVHRERRHHARIGENAGVPARRGGGRTALADDRFRIVIWLATDSMSAGWRRSRRAHGSR